MTTFELNVPEEPAGPVVDRAGFRWDKQEATNDWLCIDVLKPRVRTWEALASDFGPLKDFKYKYKIVMTNDRFPGESPYMLNFEKEEHAINEIIKLTNAYLNDSNIELVRYHRTARKLTVIFHDNQLYTYKVVKND